MEYLPLGDRVIARPIQLEKKTAAGIILTGTTDEEVRDTTFARVLAVGEGKRTTDGVLIPTKCQVGDVVVYKENMPLKFKSHEGLFDVINEANVLMIVRGQDVVEATEDYFVETSKILRDPTFLG